MTHIEEYCSQFRIGQIVETSKGHGPITAMDARFPGGFIRVKIEGFGSPDFEPFNVRPWNVDSREVRQDVAEAWGVNTFGVMETRSVSQRTFRLNEESVEACQVAGVDPELLKIQIDEVYSRPVGQIHQELGGIGLCVLLLAAAVGLSADEEEQRELRRVLNKPAKHFTARNADKNARGLIAV